MFTKTAQVEEILEVKSLGQRIGFTYGEQAGDRLVRFAASNDTKSSDGYVYVRCRAISSRVNKNNDGWPSEELMKSYKSFIGKPIFVDHNNDDPKRTRGVIIDAQIHVDDEEKTSALDPYYATAPDNHKPPTWIELLLEVDGKTYPKLGKALEDGDMDAVSMGANIEKSICSVCANEAATPDEYCSHVRKKGSTFEVTSDNGEKIRKKAYEDCYGIGFFEISNVFDPADPTADSWLDEKKAAKLAAAATEAGLDAGEVLAYAGLKNSGGLLSKAASTGRPLSKEVMNAISNFNDSKISFDELKPIPLSDLQQQSPTGDPNYVPQVDMTTAPQHVDTLRSETRCPVCHAADMETDPDGIKTCPTCGHVQEPEPVDNPDLSLARDVDLRQDVSDSTTPEGDPAVPASNPLDSVEFSPTQQAPAVAATKRSTTNEGISEMFTTILRTSSKDEAVAALSGTLKVAKAELKLGANGIHRGTYDAAKAAGITVKVAYPAVTDPENSVEIPGTNGVFNLFFAQESAANLKVPVTEVPIVVEAQTGEDLQKFMEILEKAERPSREAARKEKKPILSETAKPSDEPKANVLKDELSPRETKTVTVTEDIVEMDGKQYRLVEFDDDTPSETKDEVVEDEKEETPVADTDAAADLADEVADKDDKVEDEEDKETKLLAAFKLADMAVDMEMISNEDKMVFVAELEEESLAELKAREATMLRVKTAGLKKSAKRFNPGVTRVPRLSLSHTASSNGAVSNNDLPDEALFL